MCALCCDTTRNGEPQPLVLCPHCQGAWSTIQHLVQDPLVELNGLQAFPPDPSQSLFLWTHYLKGCASTFSIPVDKFRFLYEGPRYEQLNMGKDKCPGYCLDEHEMRPCSCECRLAWVRNILHSLHEGAVDSQKFRSCRDSTITS